MNKGERLKLIQKAIEKVRENKEKTENYQQTCSLYRKFYNDVVNAMEMP